MNKLLEKHFIKTYPKIFKDMYGDPKKTCMAWGIDCGDGWFFILDNLCHKIQHRINNRIREIKEGWVIPGKEKEIPQFVATQVKEKFGGLRLYYDGGDDYITALVDMAESLSFATCENCGALNETVGRVEKGWIQSLCPACAKEFGKEIVPQNDLIRLWQRVIKSRINKNRSWTGIDDLPKIKLKTKTKKKEK